MNALRFPEWQRLSPVVLPIAFLVLSIACWQAMAVHLRSPLIPNLQAVVNEVQSILNSGIFLKDMLATLQRVGLGLLLAVSLAFILALAMGRKAAAAQFFEPALIIGLTVPGLVWAVLCVIWFGIGLHGAAVAVALSITPAIALNLIQGVRSINQELLEVSAILQLPVSARLRYLWLPGLVAALLSGLRLGLSLAWKVIVLVEMFGLSSGIGFRLNSEFGAQNVAGVLAWTLSFATVMALIEYTVLGRLEAHFLRWQRRAQV